MMADSRGSIASMMKVIGSVQDAVSTLLFTIRYIVLSLEIYI